MSDKAIVAEIARNSRIIEHPEYGTYVVRRPTYQVQANIESARARSINMDLQTVQSIEDPATGDVRQVPAYLTRQSKAEQLKLHGIWGPQHERDLQEAIDKWRSVAEDLDKLGFEGSWVLDTQIQELKKNLSKHTPEKLAPELVVVCPSLDAAFDDKDERYKAYTAARSTIKKATRSMVVDELLRDADRLQKQLELYGDGLKAQAEMLALRMNELSLFSDTIEARADKAGQVAKIFYCVQDPDTGKAPWRNTNELTDAPSEKVAWLLGEVEKFERLEPEDEGKDPRRKDRFNFLGSLQVPAVPSEDSPEETTSKPDGDSATDQPNSSSEDLEPATQS